jgi:hypothetical protein
MADFQYWDGAAWQNVPFEAQLGPRTKLAVVWPEAKDLDGYGQPCGAVGRPDIVLEYDSLSQTGMAFWQSFFADATAMSAVAEITCPNDRLSNVWSRWYAYLARPQHDAVPALIGYPIIYHRVRLLFRNAYVTA